MAAGMSRWEQVEQRAIQMRKPRKTKAGIVDKTFKIKQEALKTPNRETA